MIHKENAFPCGKAFGVVDSYSLTLEQLVQSLTHSRGSLLAGSGSPLVLRTFPQRGYLYQREPLGFAMTNGH